MIVKYSPAFISLVKKANVRVRKSFRERIVIFSKDPDNPQLNNHPLKDEYQGCQSIDITSNWRAIYEKVLIRGEKVAYFIALGTHRELYGRS